MSALTSSSDGYDVFQNSYYVGTNVQNILFGIELCLYFKTMQAILFRKRTRRKSNVFYGVFSTAMLVATTGWVATQAIFGQKMWLLDTHYPGGPDAYWQNHISDWYMDLATTGIVLLQLMTDALMIYRCRIVWDSYRVMIVPIILWVATLALGILVDWTTSSPGGNFFSQGIVTQLGIAYYAISVFLNFFLTCMICYRILRHGKRVKERLGQEYASLYFTVSTTIVESVLPYTVSGIAFLVSYGMASSTSVAFISVYVLMMCISPQMLILRLVLGNAWDTSTFSEPILSTIQFSFGANQSGTDSLRFSSTAATVHLQASPDYLSNGHDGKV